MPDDITITFGADTADLDNAIDQAAQKVRAKFQMPAAGMPGSGVSTPLPFGLGGPPPTPGPLMRQIMQQQAGGAGGGGGGVTDISGMAGAFDAASASGSQMISMMSRMIERFIIFGVVIKGAEEAFKLFKASIEAPIKQQELAIRFADLSTNIGSAATEMAGLYDISMQTGVAIEKLAQASLTLQDTGMNAAQATDELRVLAKVAQAAGMDLNELAELMGKARLHEGTIPDMLKLVRLTEDQKEALRDLVLQYQRMQEEQNRVRMQNEVIARSQDRISEAMERSISRQGEMIQREETLRRRKEETISVGLARAEQAEDRQYQLLMRRLDAEDRMRSAHETFAEKGGVDFSQQLQQTGGSFISASRAANQAQMPGVDWSTRLALANEKAKELQLGMAQIRREEGLGEGQINQLLRARVMGQRDLLDAAKRAHEEQRRGLEYEREDRHWAIQQQRQQMEDQRRQEQYSTEDQHFTMQQTREQIEDQRREAQQARQDRDMDRELEMDRQRITMQDKITSAVQDTANAAKLWNDYTQSVGANMQLISNWFDVLLKKGFFSSMITGKLPGLPEAAAGPAAKGTDPQMQKLIEHSGKSASEMEQLNNNLSTLLGWGAGAD